MTNKNLYRIRRNRAQCMKCFHIIESKSIHDFVTCKCGSICLDGGKDYVRSAGDLEAFNYLTEYEPYGDIEAFQAEVIQKILKEKQESSKMRGNYVCNRAC